jgi:hypothetical protein
VRNFPNFGETARLKCLGLCSPTFPKDALDRIRGLADEAEQVDRAAIVPFAKPLIHRLIECCGDAGGFGIDVFSFHGLPRLVVQGLTVCGKFVQLNLPGRLGV